MKTCVVYGKLTFLTINLIIQLSDHFDLIHLILAEESGMKRGDLDGLGPQVVLHSLKFQSVGTVCNAILQDSQSIDLLLSMHHVTDPGKFWDQQSNHQWQVGFSNINQLMQLFAPFMCSQGYGTMLNVDAMEGWLDEHGFSVLTASHHALAGLTSVAAVEMRQHGVDVAMLERGYREDYQGSSAEHFVRDRLEDPKLILRQILQVALNGSKQAQIFYQSSQQRKMAMSA